MQQAAKILVVDDNEMNRILLRKKLSKIGHQIIEAENGKVALTTIHDQADINLVLLDIMMPDIDGFEVLKEVRQTYDSIELPIIMTTAMSDADHIVRCLEAGANDYITKPINLQIAQARIETCLRIHQLHAQMKTKNQLLISHEKMASLGTLSAGIAHEINNPLAIIAGKVTIARKKFTKPDKIDSIGKDLESIERATTRIAKIVKGVMAMTSQNIDEWTIANFEDIVTNAAQFFKDKARKKNCQLVTAIEDADEVCEVLISELNQAMIALICNAIDFTEGTENARVEIKSQKVGDQLLLTFEDNGPGIGASLQHAVFDPFFTTKEVGTGIGLGLSKAANCAQLHQGSLRLTNLASPTRFELKIPLRQNQIKKTAA